MRRSMRPGSGSGKLTPYTRAPRHDAGARFPGRLRPKLPGGRRGRPCEVTLGVRTPEVYPVWPLLCQALLPRTALRRPTRSAGWSRSTRPTTDPGGAGASGGLRARLGGPASRLRPHGPASRPRVGASAPNSGRRRAQLGASPERGATAAGAEMTYTCGSSARARFAHRARAPFSAISRRRSGVSFAARAFPPLRPPSFPSATAAKFLTGATGSVRSMID